jgi:nucleotidyltransferase/DNA polymerase involved in DNA repair
MHKNPFERVILHFDGDSFFASVEQVMNWKLKGKPIVTGGERGAITSASLEAKKRGVGRGLSLRDAKKVCPDLVIVPGDYLSYSIFAERVYSIVREWTPLVEEYSIDECFADITGLDRVFKKSHEEIAKDIKKKMETSLGLTFGVGMGPNKVLAKIASKHRKPAGFTVLQPETLEDFLKDLPLGKVWGIGPSTSIALSMAGVQTALEFARKPLAWVEDQKISKPYREIWLELQGYHVKELSLISKAPHSIIKSRTFTPPSMDREFIFSQLSKNIEAACVKARRHRVRTGEVRFYLKTQEFTYKRYGIPMPFPTSSPIKIIRLVKKYFNKAYRSGVLYRATGISLKVFVSEGHTMDDLFGGSRDAQKNTEVFQAVDNVARRYGEHAVHLCSSMKALEASGEKTKKTLEIPMVGVVR